MASSPARYLSLGLTLILAALTFAADRAPLLVLPQDDASFFVERMQAKGLLWEGHWNTKPWSRHQVASALTAIEGRLSSNPDLLSPSEMSAFERLKRKFSRDLPTGTTAKPYSSFFHWADSTGSSIQMNLFLFGSAWVSDSSQPADYILTPGYGGRIWGRYRDRIGFFVQDKLAGDFSNQDRYQFSFNPNDGEFTITSPQTRSDTISTNRRNYERYTGWVSGSWNGIEILAGTDSPQWGPAGLGLSGDAPPFAQVRAQARMGRLQYTWFHGSLKSASDSSQGGQIDFLQKYLVGQRIDLALKHGLNLAYSATTVYGNRDPDFVYLIPVTPLFFAQHFNGDRDNTTMGFDATWFPGRAWKIYAELFLDDLLSPTDLDGSYWGNKYAFTAGTTVYPSWFGRMWELGADYTRIEPWVYTHRFGEVTRYRHFGTILGSSLGPDSDRLRISAACRLNADFGVDAKFENRRHGHGSNGGSSVLDLFPVNGSDKEFMGGDVENEQKFDLRLNYRVLEALSFSAAVGHENGAQGAGNTAFISANLDW